MWEPHMTRDRVYVHPSAFVDEDAAIGPGTKVWHMAQVREGARIGAECILGKGAYVGEGVTIGNRVKIQNGASLYPGATVEDGVFIGPHVVFTNDRHPRAVNADGSLKSEDDWQLDEILVKEGASLGAVVVRSVPDHGLVAGNPARLIGSVCVCARRLREEQEGKLVCDQCGRRYRCDADGSVEPA